MKTTLDIDDNLLMAAKQKALDSGKTLRYIVETALEQHLKRASNLPSPIKTIVFGNSAAQSLDQHPEKFNQISQNLDDKAYWEKRFGFVPPSLR
jgi:hypothetical protein